ncbi:hypothetical protein [Salegentibacter flavus]|uniref:Uncharacterized protein n=1 Tax=Salegentibacter flavus TaxID=287099 RepID=A0A1I4ZI32_9FLAO|nr:hypothetical protein [Salegentibacter flavus]SFN49922.1 hypothetical protein SAMN05660413_01356 [Salegentibacter flavus]
MWCVFGHDFSIKEYMAFSNTWSNSKASFNLGCSIPYHQYIETDDAYF